jgi:hypothetical protein
VQTEGVKLILRHCVGDIEAVGQRVGEAVLVSNADGVREGEAELL